MILITYQKKKIEKNDKPISQTQNTEKEGWKGKFFFTWFETKKPRLRGWEDSWSEETRKILNLWCKGVNDLVCFKIKKRDFEITRD